MDNPFNNFAILLLKDRSFFKNRIHFGMNILNGHTGKFIGGNDGDLDFTYNYIQDSVITANCSNSYEYKFFLKENCKLEHCIYLITIFRSGGFKDHEVIYSTYCLEKSFDDAANEYFKFAGSNKGYLRYI
ncbi:MAG: hypothetical protein IPN89_14220 [Saprospiraceae bacterium]|nr:hypothetical protein [Saprospiraceae bacterium]